MTAFFFFIAVVWPFSMLNESYIENISELPYSPGVPEKNIQSSGHIEGWIYITGFRKMAREDGIDYVPGDPADYAIVQYDTWANLRNCGACYVVHIRNRVTVSDSGSNTTAQNNIELKWAEIVTNCDDSGCWESTIPHAEAVQIETSIESPHIYPKIDATAPVYITRYPDMGKVSIFTDSTNFSKVDYQYAGAAAGHTLKTAHVEQTRKGVYFANISSVDYWKFNGANISRFGENVLLNTNASAFDSNNLRVFVSNIYDAADLSNFSISDFHNEPERTIFNPVLFAVLGSLSVFISGACFLVKKSLFRGW
jgi:hypothetical protein